LARPHLRKNGGGLVTTRKIRQVSRSADRKKPVRVGPKLFFRGVSKHGFGTEALPLPDEKVRSGNLNFQKEKEISLSTIYQKKMSGGAPRRKRGSSLSVPCPGKRSMTRKDVGGKGGSGTAPPSLVQTATLGSWGRGGGTPIKKKPQPC